MRCALTGATGLLGGNLALALRERGHTVIATKRKTSRTGHLDGHGIEWTEASLSDPDSLAEAFEGCDVVFHCAAAVSVQYKAQPFIIEANVTGTRHVIDALVRAKVPRLVHCSTVGAVGLSVDGEPCDEEVAWNMADYALDDAYVSTKRQAQDMVLEAVRDEGLDAVIVNPTYMIGPYDARPSSGAMIVALVKGDIPGYTLGKNNFVDVRDVAEGMIAAWEKGRRGELYILGGENMTYKAFMDRVCALTGAPPVKRRVPNWIGDLLGKGGDVVQWATKKDALLNSATVRWAQTPRFIFTSAKAKSELGYTNRPLDQAILDAVAWFRANGHLPDRA